MIDESQVREKLAAMSRGALSLVELEDWLGSESWNMHADSSPGAVDLVSSIHLLLSEYDHGALSESQVRDELRALIRPPLVSRSVAIGIDAPRPVQMIRTSLSTAWQQRMVLVSG